MGWLSGWQYRRLITVDNSQGVSKNDYQVLVELNSSNFDFTKVNSDGSDLRATLSDGTTVIPLWIDIWDTVTPYARIFVKLPSISVGINQFYLYYGNPGVGSASDPFQVFDEYRDFEPSEDLTGWTTTWISASNVSYVYDIPAKYNSYGKYYKDPSTGYGAVVDYKTLSQYEDFIAELWVYVAFNYSYYDQHYGILLYKSGSTVYRAGLSNPGASNSPRLYAIAGYKLISLWPNNNVWYFIRAKVQYDVANNQTTCTTEVYHEDLTLMDSYTYTSSVLANVIGVHLASGYSQTGKVGVDSLRKMKWIYPDPIVTVGSEELAPPLGSSRRRRVIFYYGEYR